MPQFREKYPEYKNSSSKISDKYDKMVIEAMVSDPEKEDEDRKKIKKIIKTIEDKNIRLLPQFREKYPDYNNSSSKTSDKYDKIVVEAMTSDENKNEKIIKNISNATIIKKL